MSTAGGGNSLVVDLSSQSLRVGIAGEDCPAFNRKSAVGIPAVPSDLRQAFGAQNLFPLDPGSKKDNLQLSYPLTFTFDNLATPATSSSPGDPLQFNRTAIETALLTAVGVARHETSLEKLTSNQMLLMCEPSSGNRGFRSALAQVIFEDLTGGAVAFCKRGALTVYGCGRTSGLVLDSGYSRTTACVVQEGFVIPKSVTDSALCGRLLNSALISDIQQSDGSSMELLPAFAYLQGGQQRPRTPEPAPAKPGPPSAKLNRLFPSSRTTAAPPIDLPFVHPSYRQWAVEEVAEAFKEAFCHCRIPPADPEGIKDAGGEQDCAQPPSPTPPSRPATSSAPPYRLPDGTQIDTDSFSESLPEALFDRDIAQTKFGSQDQKVITMQDCIDSALSASELWQNREITQGILVTGGNTCISGFAERLQCELVNHEQMAAKCASTGWKMVASPRLWERQLTSWIGGSILASLGSFSSIAVTRSEYLEFGEVAIQRKCP